MRGWFYIVRAAAGCAILAVATTGLLASMLGIPFHGTPYEWMVAFWGSLFGLALASKEQKE